MVKKTVNFLFWFFLETLSKNMIYTPISHNNEQKLGVNSC